MRTIAGIHDLLHQFLEIREKMVQKFINSSKNGDELLFISNLAAYSVYLPGAHGAQAPGAPNCPGGQGSADGADFAADRPVPRLLITPAASTCSCTPRSRSALAPSRAADSESSARLSC